MQESFNFPELPEYDLKVIRPKIEEMFARYRIFKKAVSFRRKHAQITSSPEPRFHGNTNLITDQTAQVAIENVTEEARRIAFCEWIEAAVNELDEEERNIIVERYMKSARVHDYVVYNQKLRTPIGETKYYEIKKSALFNLAMLLGITE